MLIFEIVGQVVISGMLGYAFYWLIRKIYYKLGSFFKKKK